LHTNIVAWLGALPDDGKITLESEMDVETSAAIDRVSDRIDALDVSVNDRIDALDASVNGRIDALDVSVNDRIDALDASVNGRTDELRAEVRDGFVEARRHTDVLFESLRDDIRILADGVAHVSAKLDSLQR
jgi:tetrahydromethanopterin S-methyltransferase subunit B